MSAPARSSPTRRHRRERRFRLWAQLCVAGALLMLGWLLVDLLRLGLPALLGANPLEWLARGDAAEPGRAGLATAALGSAMSLAVVALVALPLGVASAVYLEEFAPRRGAGVRLARALGVLIGNLAAIPGIVYGLLGLAVLINGAGLARSAVITAALVLALRVFPTVVIASRGAIRSVSDAVVDGALSLGASRMQAVFGQKLPLAAPGMVTGALLALAQALGEAAPLLLIGMVAFVSRPPAALDDPATTVPVQAYMWVQRAEPAWQAQAGAAVLVLLLVLVGINLLAAWARRRLARRRYA